MRTGGDDTIQGNTDDELGYQTTQRQHAGPGDVPAAPPRAKLRTVTETRSQPSDGQGPPEISSDQRTLHTDASAVPPALGEARELFRRASEASPWHLDYRVERARIELLDIRSAMSRQRAEASMFEAAFAPLGPLLSEERADPNFYEALAEIHALRAAWLLDGGKSPAEDVTQGLVMADKALSINPRMATASAVKADLHLIQARAARDPRARTEAAQRAQRAFEDAFRSNPLLEREHGAALNEAARLR